MHLAFCSDTEAFNKDQLRDRQWSLRFPGSGWVSCLYGIAAKAGINVASGDVAIANIASNKWNAKDIYVIQDMVSADAVKLLDSGARPFLATCLEAPLYAPRFYDNIGRITAGFKYRLGFGFSEDQYGAKGSRNSLQFRFPSYFLDDLRNILPWHGRKKLVLVAANKYRTDKVFVPSRPGAINMLRQLKSLALRSVSPAYRKALAASLHDQRLDAIEFFAARKELDLYGEGWDRWEAHPASRASRLRELVGGQYLGRCGNKQETLGDYRYSICFENMVLPGYMTEKMIDCFVAGTVPLYRGAPDIEALVPVESFIDLRKFDSYDQVDALMDAMNEQAALNMINAGREYLKTGIGRLHSYEGFAENVIRLAQTC